MRLGASGLGVWCFRAWAFWLSGMDLEGHSLGLSTSGLELKGTGLNVTC